MLRKIRPLVFLAAVMLLAFWKVLFHPEFTLLTGGDMCSQTFPWFNIAAYWLKKGSLLLWDPYVYSGKANLGELQPGVLYPLNWLFMLLPASGGGINLEGLQALLILNYFLAGGFTYLLARSFAITPWGAAASGVAFALGGYTIQVQWICKHPERLYLDASGLVAFPPGSAGENIQSSPALEPVVRSLPRTFLSCRTPCAAGARRTAALFLHAFHTFSRLEAIAVEGPDRPSPGAGRRSAGCGAV